MRLFNNSANNNMKRKNTSSPKQAEKKIKLVNTEEGSRSDVLKIAMCLESAYIKIFGTDPDVKVPSGSRYQQEMQDIYNFIKDMKDDLEDPKISAPIFGTMNRGKSFIANFLLCSAHPTTRDLKDFNRPLPSFGSVSAASKVPVRIQFCSSNKDEVRLQFVQATTAEIEDRLKDDVNKLTKLQEINVRTTSNRYQDYCALLSLDSIAEVHRRLCSPDELDDIALSHFVLYWPTDSVDLKNLEIIELPGIGEYNWRAARIAEMVKDSDVAFSPYSIRDDYLMGFQYLHYYGVINDTSPRLPWIAPIINVSREFPDIPPSSTLPNDKDSLENCVRQKMDEVLSLSAAHARPDFVLFDRMNNCSRVNIAQKVKASMRILHFYTSVVGTAGSEYNFLKEFESVVRDCKKQKQHQIVLEIMKKSISFMCLANMFLYRRNISAENQEAARNFKLQLDQDLKEIKSELEISLKDVRRKLQSHFEILCNEGTCDYSVAADFVKKASFSFTKEWKEKLRAHHNQLIERCHTLVCDTKDNEYITNVKEALEEFCISRLEKFEQTVSGLPERRLQQYQKLIKLVKKKDLKAGSKFTEALLRSLPCVVSGDAYFAEIQQFAEHLIFSKDGKILAVKMNKKVAEEIRKEFNDCKKIIRDKYNMAPPRGKQSHHPAPHRPVSTPLPQPQFYHTNVKTITDNNLTKSQQAAANGTLVTPSYFGLKFTEKEGNSEKHQLEVTLNQNLAATFTAPKSFMNELKALSTKITAAQSTQSTIAPWFISIARSEVGSVDNLLQSNSIQDLITRGEHPMIIVHIKDNDEVVKFQNDCVYQLSLKSTNPLSALGKVEVIKQLADYLSAKQGIIYYWFQIGPISTLREYNINNNQMEVTDPARALLVGQMAFISFRENLVKEQCDFLNEETTKDALVNIYQNDKKFSDIVKLLIKPVTPANVQAWMSNLPDCPEKNKLFKPVEKHSANRIGAVNISYYKDAIYQCNYKTQGKQHYVASRVTSSIALFNPSMARRNTCKKDEMFVEGGGKKTPNFKPLFKSLVTNGCYNLVVFSFEYL